MTLSPDEQSALDDLYTAYERLRMLGWQEARYCPKDGSPFQVIEVGSTGTFVCTYFDGFFMVQDGRDVYPTLTAVVLFKPISGK